MNIAIIVVLGFTLVWTLLVLRRERRVWKRKYLDALSGSILNEVRSGVIRQGYKFAEALEEYAATGFALKEFTIAFQEGFCRLFNNAKNWKEIVLVRQELGLFCNDSPAYANERWIMTAKLMANEQIRHQIYNLYLQQVNKIKSFGHLDEQVKQREYDRLRHQAKFFSKEPYGKIEFPQIGASTRV